MNLNFRQQSVGETTYLVLDMDDDELLVDSFAMNMMAHNHMNNVVPTQIVRINERKQVQFNITGLAKLNSRIAAVRPKKEVLLIFNSILNAFEEVDAYMLDMEHLFLDWDHIYLDGQGNCKLLYLPFDSPFERDKIEFLREGVSRIKPDFQEKDPYLFEILNAFSRGAVQKLSDFRELIKKSAGITKEEAREEIKFNPSEKLPENAAPMAATLTPEKKEIKMPEIVVKKEEKKSSVSPKIPVINIPGREPGAKTVVQEPLSKKKEEKKKEEKKKEEKKGFFKRGSGKKDSLIQAKKHKEPQIAIPEAVSSRSLEYSEPIGYQNNSKVEDMYESYESTVIMQEPVVRPEEDEGTVLLQQTEILAQTSAKLVRKQDGFTYQISNSRVMVGSGMTADIHIDNNHAISRNHVLIQYVNGSYYVEDNQSKNGSYLNGRRLQPGIKESLYDGAVLRLANEDFEFFES